MIEGFRWFVGGGPVMPLLLVVGLVLYALIIERALAIRAAVRRAEPLDAAGGLLVLRALIAAAPLLGLLGTVTGMIACFEGLVEGGRTEDVGLGIGYALRTTEYGLTLAVPAIVLERLISRRSARYDAERRAAR